ncbi:MAG: Na+/H+ antiporter subunit E [Halanaerobiales bacterium]|nr:Na+/H+ antiporter subunit E [Halanaerobiales bacterium]
MNLKKFLSTFLIYLVFWTAYTSSLKQEELLIGIIISFFLSLFTYKSFSQQKSDNNILKRLLSFIAYIPIFITEMVKANIDVAQRVINPKLPINPGIVKIPTKLKSEYAKLFLANSITLTPGTLTLDVKDQNLYIHWIDLSSEDKKIQKEIISDKFEKHLEGMF